MSPQNINSLGYDGQANEVWSMGVILFQMVTGSFPYTLRKEFSFDQIAEEIKQKSLALEFEIKDIVLECLQIQEYKRPSLEYLLTKVGKKLSKIHELKQMDDLPKCDWQSIMIFKPLINLKFIQ